MRILETAAIVLALVSLAFAGCVSQAESHEELHGESHGETEAHADAHGGAHEEAHGESGHHAHKIIVTSPVIQDVISTQQYVCQIHSCKHIEVKALEGGYLEDIRVNEGQEVTKGDLMFKILPTIYQAKLDSESAEMQRIEIELFNAEALNKKGIVSPQEIMLKKAELAKAKANMELAKAELNFTDVKAPFDGIVDRQLCQLGSLIEEGDILTTLSDNSLMWVYFNVPEARYLEYKEELDKNEGSQEEHLTIELKLANGKIFPQHGKIGAIEADFNNTTGNIEFRADFPNPNSLLRNGQTGTILIHRLMKDVFVIPQRATYEILDKRYAYVVDKDNVVHQRDIVVDSEQEDIFVLKSGLAEGEKIIFEGIRQVRDGDKIEYEYRAPEEILNHQKFPAE
ncbi:efflux RND transporter periplasmic adaptor subunit [Blastopirellula sp. JC732]|uniref:Efflux RND transporter periplasmic adaptor subunit n=1 Tax=Blastopirellula sediminis TaxID=2894196 RepID=A0A9X1SGV5_9BACT|nr:efflux RND transporter periplasmic adaptor subunit [Blastopirellula sediminis]MCC9606136.1 efflux RND transporter periplasmic adaptor subunit [Blastopirellula sediminis]MCC9630565.1 efflux RND transporter periplasmic adaptor subunit [Blastopirellula sediminis]